MESTQQIKNFEKEFGRIKTIIKIGKIAIKAEWSNIPIGEFPITEWRTFPLEVPSARFKYHILGRSLDDGTSEVIHLPMYIGEDICDAKIFEDILEDPIKTKEVAMIPAVTISTKFCGNYSSTDGHLTQSVAVLPIWADGTSMVLELDWFEQTEENNNAPEWYIKASGKLSVKEGFGKIKECFKPYPLVNFCHYLYINPISLGTHVLGEGQEHPNKFWSREWKFNQHEMMSDALDRLSETLNRADISVIKDN